MKTLLYTYNKFDNFTLSEVWKETMYYIARKFDIIYRKEGHIMYSIFFTLTFLKLLVNFSSVSTI